MNDFYWFNIEKTDIFYILPEKILLDQNKIEDQIILKTKPRFNIYINKNNMWYSKFKYDYNNIDLNLIKNIFI